MSGTGQQPPDDPWVTVETAPGQGSLGRKFCIYRVCPHPESCATACMQPANNPPARARRVEP